MAKEGGMEWLGGPQGINLPRKLLINFYCWNSRLKGVKFSMSNSGHCRASKSSKFSSPLKSWLQCLSPFKYAISTSIRALRIYVFCNLKLLSNKNLLWSIFSLLTLSSDFWLWAAVTAARGMGFHQKETYLTLLRSSMCTLPYLPNTTQSRQETTLS